MAKILVIGGSLGGLFAANMLLRQGHDVALLEKTLGSLDGRGAGIVTHSTLTDALRASGVTVDDTLGVHVTKRITLGADGQSLGEVEFPQVLTSWSRLYHMLKEVFPIERYHQGKTVKTVSQDAHAVHVQCEDGTQYTAEILIASDGIRSAVRAQVAPNIHPEYAGYIAWRGVCDETCLSHYTLDTLFNYFGFCLPNGEQMLGYPVAGSGNDTRPGKRRYNFVWYRPASEYDELISLLTDDDGHYHPNGIPPLRVSWKHISQMRKAAQNILAPQYAEILEKTAAPFLQAIYDVRSEEIVFDRIALMGDAAFVGRPHVGMGVTKAGDEALAIAKHIAALGATPAALQAYRNERLPMGQQVVARAQYLGRYMQAQGSKGNRDNEKLKRNADTVMAETAIDLSELLAQGKAVPEFAL